MIRQRDFTCSMLLRASLFEADHLGGYKPVQIVAQCIGNRVRLGWGDWHQVLDRLSQFSAQSPEIRNQRWLETPLPKINDPKFIALLPLIEKVYDNSSEQLAGEATIWATTDDLANPTNPWFMEHVVGLTPSFRRIGGSGNLLLWG